MKPVALTAFAQAMLAGGTALQAFMLLHAQDATSFGQFALVMLWLGWCLALSAALTGAPALINRQPYASQLWQLANRRLAAVLALLAMLLFYSWQLPLWAIIGFAVSHFCLVSRSLQRQLLHQSGASGLAATQDLAYASVIIVGTGVLFLSGLLSLTMLAALNALAGLGLLFVMHKTAITGARRQLRLRRGWPLLRAGFVRQGAAALTGVLAIELLANGYLYLLGSWQGPAAVAPIAAVLLLFRPVAVLLQGMSQRWRPDLWGALQQQPSGANVASVIASQLKRMQHTVLGLVLANIALALLLLWLLPELVWPHGEAAILWQLLPLAALLVALRAVRQSWLLLLQAQNRFAELARAELWPAVVLLPICWSLLSLQLPVFWLMIAAIGAELAVSIRVYRTVNRTLFCKAQQAKKE